MKPTNKSLKKLMKSKYTLLSMMLLVLGVTAFLVVYFLTKNGSSNGSSKNDMDITFKYLNKDHEQNELEFKMHSILLNQFLDLNKITIGFSADDSIYSIILDSSNIDITNIVIKSNGVDYTYSSIDGIQYDIHNLNELGDNPQIKFNV